MQFQYSRLYPVENWDEMHAVEHVMFQFSLVGYNLLVQRKKLVTQWDPRQLLA